MNIEFQNDKRRARRVPVSMKLEETALGFGYAANISEVGMAVEAEALIEELPPLGSELRMKFKLPAQDFVITTRARVVRVDLGVTPRIALEFVGLAPDVRSAISRYVQHQILA